MLLAAGRPYLARALDVGLIANSIFQRGRCRYRNIRFENADGHCPVWEMAQGATEGIC